MMGILPLFDRIEDIRRKLDAKEGDRVPFAEDQRQTVMMNSLMETF